VRPVRRRATLAPLLLALAGCAEGKADVTGKVAHQGKTVTWGTVIVQGPDGIPMTGKIQPDGTYTVRGVTAGKVLIGVVSRDPGVLASPRGRRVDKGEGNGQPAERPPLADRSKWFPLPTKYEDPNQSGLATALKGGPNAYDIDLP
jgi:hypothetical protein